MDFINCKKLDSKYKYGKNKRYIATQQKKKVGTKLLAQLRKGGWKLARNTSKREKNKAPEITQDILESKIDQKIVLLKTV